MKVVIKRMLMLFLGLAALSIASPVVARPHHRADPMDAARAAANAQTQIDDGFASFPEQKEVEIPPFISPPANTPEYLRGGQRQEPVVATKIGVFYVSEN